MAKPIIENKVRERNTFSIIASDGVEYAHWMTNAGMQSTQLPGFFLIDFVIMSVRRDFCSLLD